MKLTKLQSELIAEREKRQVAIHEAAHAAVCFRFGGYGVAEVWKNTAQNVKAGEKAWRGRFKMFAEPGKLQMDDRTRQDLGVLPAPKNWRVLLGLAGLVAEHIADGIVNAEEIAGLIDYTIDMDEASTTDINLMGDWQVSDVAEALHLLCGMWPTIEREAAALAT